MPISRMSSDCAKPSNDAEEAHFTGLAELQSRHYDAAIAHLRRACELQPASAQFQYNLGEAYRLAHQPAPAADAYHAALAIDPTHPKAHFGLAMASLALSRPDQAVRAARVAGE